jgi:Fur family ferric uptake transcriptional regulator
MWLQSSDPPRISPKDWLALLQAHGHRLTAPRRAVVETMAASRTALRPSEILDRARGQGASLGLVTVYRTLEKLEALDLVRRVHHLHQCNAYVAVGHSMAQLLVCRVCGRTDYFRCDGLDQLLKHLLNEQGYRIEHYWLQLIGHCGDCQHATVRS